MPPPASAAVRTLLEKTAFDNGFSSFEGEDGGWLAYSSTKAPLRVWLARPEGSGFLVGLSQGNVANALTEGEGVTVAGAPNGAVAVRAVSDLGALHGLLRRAFQLSRSLPDELLRTYERELAGTLGTTEAEQIVKRRVGQEVFRKGLLEYWQGQCAITGLAVAELLRASHIKPWADCASDGERLDAFNGLLLAAHLDAAFDRGLISVADDGVVLVSAELGADARAVLGLTEGLRVERLRDQHRVYLPWHRERLFRGGGA